MKLPQGDGTSWTSPLIWYCGKIPIQNYGIIFQALQYYYFVKYILLIRYFDVRAEAYRAIELLKNSTSTSDINATDSASNNYEQFFEAYESLETDDDQEIDIESIDDILDDDDGGSIYFVPPKQSEHVDN